MIVFDGKAFATQKEHQLKTTLSELTSTFGTRPHVGCILFIEDEGGIVYTREKKAVADRIGIGFKIVKFSISDPVEKILHQVESWNEDPNISGIIIQKPMRSVWKNQNQSTDFNDWWHQLTSQISLAKDVDGLNPQTLQAIKDGSWKAKKLVLPATCKGVLSTLSQYTMSSPLEDYQIVIIGRSELLGKPLYYFWKNIPDIHVDLFGRKQLQAAPDLKKYSIIISSTGVPKLITADMIQPGSIVIDAGFPLGDVDFETVAPLTKAITPVPNGVGPVTVISLLENAVELWYNSRS